MDFNKYLKSQDNQKSLISLLVCTIVLFTNALNVQIKFKHYRIGDRFYWYSLEGSNDNGEFSGKVFVSGSVPTAVAGGPADFKSLKARSALTSGGIKLKVPAWSAVFVMVDFRPK